MSGNEECTATSATPLNAVTPLPLPKIVGEWGKIGSLRETVYKPKVSNVSSFANFVE
jgi:hypothetical protein